MKFNVVVSRPVKGKLKRTTFAKFNSRLSGFLDFANCGCFQGIPLAPLWDFGKGQFVGVLGPLDFILILREVGFSKHVFVVRAFLLVTDVYYKS